MAIDPELLEILACPVCKVSVTPTRDGAGLLCARCLRIYPIVDDIPVMLVEEAVQRKDRRKTSAARTASSRPKPAPKSKRKARAKAEPKARARSRS